MTDNNGAVIIPKDASLFEVFESITLQGIEWVDAQQGSLFFLDESETLSSLNSELSSKAARKIAEYSFLNQKNVLLKKGEMIPQTNLFVEETYICCTISTPNREKKIGVFLLEGIKNFENFSIEDFNLIQVYCDKLGLLLKDSLFLQDIDDLYSKFTTSLFLLLDSTDTHRKNTKLDFLIKEVIRVSGLINTSQHLSSLLRELMESVKSVFRTESCSILLVDKEKNDLYFHIIAGEKEEEISKIRVPMGQGIAGTVAVTREPMVINDAQNDNRVYKAADKTSGFVTRNMLAAPLVANNDVIGVMEAINTTDRNNFDDNEIDLFLSFSGAAAVAIQKARLLDDLQKANTELEKKVSELGSLFDLGQAVLESNDVNELLLRSLSIIVRELDANRAVVITLDETKKNLHLMSSTNGIQKQARMSYLNDSIIVHSIMDNRIVLNNNIKSSDHDSSFDQEYLVGSYIILPLTDSNRKAFGAICISDRKDRGVYTEGHLRLLQTISSQLIKGYENIKLNDDLIAKKTLQKELEITSKIQKHILPHGLPSGSNFDFAAKSVPAKEVSGDFYDFYKYEDGQFSFLIADVSGKSLPAAIFMAMSSSIIRTLSRNHELSPDQLLETANGLIYEDSESGMFVTLFFIHYNPASFAIEFASAGHNDQIWIKADGTYELIKGKGAPLGVIPSGVFKGGTIKPKAGDMIVLYTDGAIEQDNKKQEEFGLESFVEEIIKRKELPAKEIVEQVYEEIMLFSENKPQFDDFTVLILKFNDDYQFHRKFAASNKEIPKFREFLFDTIKVKNLNQILCEDILLCCDEAATNIVMHSYAETELKNPSFDCYVRFTEDTMYILLQDRGKGFLRSQVKKPSLEANLKGERKGGFGIFLIEKLMDKVSYSSEDGVNSILIEKRIATDS